MYSGRMTTDVTGMITPVTSDLNDRIFKSNDKMRYLVEGHNEGNGGVEGDLVRIVIPTRLKRNNCQ